MTDRSTTTPADAAAYEHRRAPHPDDNRPARSELLYDDLAAGPRTLEDRVRSFVGVLPGPPGRPVTVSGAYVTFPIAADEDASAVVAALATVGLEGREGRPGYMWVRVADPAAADPFAV